MIPICILAIEDPDDREFMTTLYGKCERILYNTTIKITNNYWDAQDVVQSVLVKIIHNKIPLLRSLPERKQFNYLITACHNEAVNCVKKRQNQSYDFPDSENDSFISDIPDDAPSLDEILLSQEEQQLFLKAWETLDERTKYFLNARYILEQSVSEIAEELHTSQAQVSYIFEQSQKKSSDCDHKIKKKLICNSQFPFVFL